MRAKDKRDSDLNAQKTQREQARKETAAKQEKNARLVREEIRELRSSPEKFPGYAQLVPVMEALLEINPEIAGHPSTPKLLFYAAKGLQGLKGERAALAKTAEERKKAEADAAARAAAGGAPAGPTHTTPAGKGLDPFNAALVAAGPKSLLP